MRALRFLALMLTALTMGMAFCHLLQMPAKLAYSGPQWLLLQQTLYGNYRALGALIDVGAVACALALTLAVRARHPALGWTLFGTICLAGAHAAWWAGIVPLNAQIAQLTPHVLPPEWAELRLQWEYTHAMRFALLAAALGALVLSVVVETPRRRANWFREPA
jgi:hypothetical protein